MNKEIQKEKNIDNFYIHRIFNKFFSEQKELGILLIGIIFLIIGSISIVYAVLFSSSIKYWKIYILYHKITNYNIVILVIGIIFTFFGLEKRKIENKEIQKSKFILIWMLFFIISSSIFYTGIVKESAIRITSNIFLFPQISVINFLFPFGALFFFILFINTDIFQKFRDFFFNEFKFKINIKKSVSNFIKTKYFPLLILLVIFTTISLISSYNKMRFGHDEFVYLNHVEFFRNGTGYHEMYQRPPFFPFLLFLISKINYQLIFCINPLLYIISGMEIYKIIQDKYNKKWISFIATLIFYSNIWVFFTSFNILREMLQLFLVITSIFLYKYNKRRFSYLTISLSLLTAWNNLGFVFGFVIVDGIIIIRENYKNLIPFKKNLKTYRKLFFDISFRLLYFITPLILYEIYLRMTFEGASLLSGWGPFHYTGLNIGNNQYIIEIFLYFIGIFNRLNPLLSVLFFVSLGVILIDFINKIRNKKKLSISNLDLLIIIPLICLIFGLSSFAPVGYYIRKEFENVFVLLKDYFNNEIPIYGDPIRLSFPIVVMIIYIIIKGIIKIQKYFKNKEFVKHFRKIKDIIKNKMIISIFIISFSMINLLILFIIPYPYSNGDTAFEAIRYKRFNDNDIIHTGLFIKNQYNDRNVKIEATKYYPHLSYYSNMEIRPFNPSFVGKNPDVIIYFEISNNLIIKQNKAGFYSLVPKSEIIPNPYAELKYFSNYSWVKVYKRRTEFHVFERIDDLKTNIDVVYGALNRSLNCEYYNFQKVEYQSIGELFRPIENISFTNSRILVYQLWNSYENLALDIFNINETTGEINTIARSISVNVNGYADFNFRREVELESNNTYGLSVYTIDINYNRNDYSGYYQFPFYNCSETTISFEMKDDTWIFTEKEGNLPFIFY